MARTAAESSTSVNFRMPDSLLKNIDELARRNHHERTAEINGACRHWIEIGGVAASDKTTHSRIGELENTIRGLTVQLEESGKEIAELRAEIQTLAREMESERVLLLKIIEGNETTINNLLSALPLVNKQE